MKKYIFIIIFISLVSCSFFRDVEDLGNGFYLDTNWVLYTDKSEYNGVGTIVIPEDLICLKYNKYYILVISLNYKHQLCYWLIDKTKISKEIGFSDTSNLLNSYYKFENIKLFENRETFENEIKLMNINPYNSDWEYTENGNPNLEKFLKKAHQTFGFVEK